MGSFIFQVFIGLLITAVGFTMMWKTEWYLRILGRNLWAERTFGGGTRTLHKLIGFAAILIGFIVVTDLWDNFMVWLIGGLFVR